MEILKNLINLFKFLTYENSDCNTSMAKTKIIEKLITFLTTFCRENIIIPCVYKNPKYALGGVPPKPPIFFYLS